MLDRSTFLPRNKTAQQNCLLVKTLFLLNTGPRTQTLTLHPQETYSEVNKKALQLNIVAAGTLTKVQDYYRDQDTWSFGFKLQ